MSDISQRLRDAADALEKAASGADGPWMLGGYDKNGYRHIGAHSTDQCTGGACGLGYGHEPGCGYELMMTVPREVAPYLMLVEPTIGSMLVSWLRAEAIGLDEHGACRSEAVQLATRVLAWGELT